MPPKPRSGERSYMEMRGHRRATLPNSGEFGYMASWKLAPQQKLNLCQAVTFGTVSRYQSLTWPVITPCEETKRC